MDERLEAVVVGGGAAGLAAGAMLRRAGVAAPIVERTSAVGSSWRSRYDGLRLNTLRWSSALPGYACDRRYGRWPTRDEWVRYLEDYAAHHQLDLRFGIELRHVDRDGDDWRLTTSDGTITAGNVVLALGLDHDPFTPTWPGLDDFTGRLLHASAYRNPLPFAGKDVLIVGPGNTGSEIAFDLVRGGARLPVRASMRTPPNVINREQLGLPIMHVLGLLNERVPPRIFDPQARVLQRLVFGDLTPYGLGRPPFGVKENVVKRGIAPLVDDGFIAALKSGHVEIVPEIERFDGSDVVLVDGRRLRPEAVICATGYRRGLEPLVGHLGVVDGRLGLPRVLDGRADPSSPGLYFAGYAPRISGTLARFKHEARRIARSVAKRVTAERRR
jgi:putative flavoprotein involved in K+ transport